jgi:hypothetical protein
MTDKEYIAACKKCLAEFNYAGFFWYTATWYPKDDFVKGLARSLLEPATIRDFREEI